MNASRLLVGAVVIIAVGACGGGGSKQAVTPECDQAVIKVAALPGLNATPEQTPDIVNSTRTATLIACRSAAEWKAAVAHHPEVLPPKASAGDGLKAFCRDAYKPTAKTSPTCKGSK